MNTTQIIALTLGVFFIFAAMLKRFAANADRRRRADEENAARQGGTPDAPVHLESPFPVPAGNATADSSGASASPDAGDSDGYVWL